MAQTIGIDLGSSYCCAAVMVKGKVEIISSEVGLNTIPSYVAFTAAENLVGDGALAQAPKNLANTVYDIKSLMGHSLTDVNAHNKDKNWPFKLEAGENNKPLVNVQYMGEEKKCSAEELSAMLLTKMKDLSEEFLGKPVENVVITVPAYFNDA
jgi:heat shock 70kDa protein 1/2/6/8